MSKFKKKLLTFAIIIIKLWLRKAFGAEVHPCFLVNNRLG
jgi:hypothetical protein